MCDLKSSIRILRELISDTERERKRDGIENLIESMINHLIISCIT